MSECFLVFVLHLYWTRSFSQPRPSWLPKCEKRWRQCDSAIIGLRKLALVLYLCCVQVLQISSSNSENWKFKISTCRRVNFSHMSRIRFAAWHFAGKNVSGALQLDPGHFTSTASVGFSTKWFICWIYTHDQYKESYIQSTTCIKSSTYIPLIHPLFRLHAYVNSPSYH